MATAKVYIRLSKDEDGQTSTADQERECRKLAARLTISDIQVYCEEPGTSGFKDVVRPVFDDLIATLSPGDIVLAWALDRLTRKGMEQAGTILRRLEESGAHLITVSDGIDTRHDAGTDINVGIRAIMAREYSKSLSKNTKRGKETAAATGAWSGGRRSYGYAPDIDGKWRGPITLDETEAKVLDEIRRRYVSGERMLNIANDLNQRGIPTVDGSRWRPENMLSLLLNKRYIGLNNIGVAGTWPPIFTAAEREEVQAIRRQADRMKHWPTSPTGARTYLLTGFVYCSCGKLMRGGARRLRGKYQRRYVCHHCYILSRNAEPLELLVIEAIFFRLDTPELGKLLEHSDVPSDLIHNLTSEIEAKTSTLQRLLDDYTDGLLDRAEYARAKQRATAAKEAAEMRLHRELAQRTNLHINAGETVREWFEKATIENRRQLVALLVEKIVVKPSDTDRIKKADYWRGYRFRPEDVEVHWLA